MSSPSIEKDQSPAPKDWFALQLVAVGGAAFAVNAAFEVATGVNVLAVVFDTLGS